MLLKNAKKQIKRLIEERYYNDSVDNINTNNYYDRQLFIRRIIVKLNTKHKAKIRREVDLDLGIKSPRKIIFTSKKVYSRKKKHKLNTNEDG